MKPPTKAPAMKNLFLLLFAIAIAGSSITFADGDGDNNPEKVRRVPRLGIEVRPDIEIALRTKLKTLQEQMKFLTKAKSGSLADQMAPDVMIFERAVRVALDHQAFFHERDLKKADALLDEGLQRVAQLKNGRANWASQTGLVVRGFISRIDHTVQPYGVVVPSTYSVDHSQPTRCDIWFHGRGESVNEVNFLYERMTKVGRYSPSDTIMLHPYGRYSNAFKFAGETDVQEALADVQKRYSIDEDRTSVRGFSMGGAACWQFAVHEPGRWFAANPGAGFAETPQFLKSFQNETLHPKPWERSLWNLYDCDKYALNLSQLATIAYSGEIDQQKQAADVMEAALAEHGISLRHVIGKGMAHNIDERSKVVIDESLKRLAVGGRDRVPEELNFETYTLKYNKVAWLTIDAIDEHWKRASIRASIIRDEKGLHQYLLQPNQIKSISLNFPAATFAPPFLNRPNESKGFRVILLDDKTGQQEYMGTVFSDGSGGLQLHRQADGGWTTGPLALESGSLVKKHNLQGPIDDAFMEHFVFVRPTGQAFHPMVQKWTESEMERAIEHWRRHFRGDAIVIDDVDVTDKMIQSDTNLVLWGDRSSNKVLAKIADQLPIQWTSETVTAGDRTWSATDHAPILIYPNPLNPERYVVLNSSFTYRDYAYLNNARQVPMLPDWAVIDLKTPAGNVWPGKVVAADFFDESWQLKN
ncbi:MAG: hypothetical protein ABJZ55_17645 [Fuerstiella sp.]